MATVSVSSVTTSYSTQNLYTINTVPTITTGFLGNARISSSSNVANAGTTLTVNSVGAGVLSLGSIITGNGITAANIVSLGSGLGGVGTYNLDGSPQLVGNVTITGTLPGKLATAGATYYGTVTEPVSLSTAGNVTVVGNAVTQANGIYSVAANTTWLLTAAVSLTGQISTLNPPNFGWYNATTGNLIGSLSPVTQPVTTTFVNGPGVANVVLKLEKDSTHPFKYPNRLMSATATVVELSGSTAA